MLTDNHYIEIPMNIPGIQFLRVGVPGDGKCLIHALLFLLNEKYITLDTPTKIRDATEFIRQFRDTLTVDNWDIFHLGEGSIQLQIQLRALLERKFTDEYLDTLFQKMDLNGSFKDMIQLMGRETQDKMHPSEFTQIVQIMNGYKQRLYEQYKQTLIQCQSLGHEEIKYFSHQYKINIAIVDERGKIFWGSTYNQSYAVHFMICNLGGMHWEPVIISINNTVYRSIPNQVLKNIIK